MVRTLLHRGRWERCLVVLCFLLCGARREVAESRPLGEQQPPDRDKEPDLWAPMQALVPASGYQLSEHFALTEDGYILRLFRLQATSALAEQRHMAARGAHARQPAPVVLLQHALLDTSAGWLLKGPGKALAFMLADQGYDVFMGNVRGNRFSRNHTRLDPNTDVRFWAFSWDHFATKDLPAMVQTALQASGASSLQYIGYSQGTTMALVGLSALPDLARRISLAVLLAPVAFVGHITSRPFSTLAHLQTAEMFGRWGLREFGPHDDTAAGYYTSWCSTMPWACIKWLQFLCGANPYTNIDHPILSVLMEYLPAGTSVMNMAQWGQGVRAAGSGPTGLRMFDYGTDCPPTEQRAAADSAAPHTPAHAPSFAATTLPLEEQQQQDRRAAAAAAEFTVWRRDLKQLKPRGHSRHADLQASVGIATCNQWEYGQLEPPAYNLSQITTPLVLFTGGQDSLSDPQDVQLLLAALPRGVVRTHHHTPEYAHLDFGLGTDAHQRLYPHVLEALGQGIAAAAAAASGLHTLEPQGQAVMA